eukprot:Opistho-1_new@6245
MDYDDFEYEEDDGDMRARALEEELARMTGAGSHKGGGGAHGGGQGRNRFPSINGRNGPATGAKKQQQGPPQSKANATHLPHLNGAHNGQSAHAHHGSNGSMLGDSGHAKLMFPSVHGGGQGPSSDPRHVPHPAARPVPQPAAQWGREGPAANGGFQPSYPPAPQPYAQHAQQQQPASFGPRQPGVGAFAYQQPPVPQQHPQQRYPVAQHVQQQQQHVAPASQPSKFVPQPHFQPVQRQGFRAPPVAPAFDAPLQLQPQQAPSMYGGSFVAAAPQPMYAGSYVGQPAFPPGAVIYGDPLMASTYPPSQRSSSQNSNSRLSQFGAGNSVRQTPTSKWGPSGRAAAGQALPPQWAAQQAAGAQYAGVPVYNAGPIYVPVGMGPGMAVATPVYASLANPFAFGAGGAAIVLQQGAQAPFPVQAADAQQPHAPASKHAAPATKTNAGRALKRVSSDGRGPARGQQGQHHPPQRANQGTGQTSPTPSASSSQSKGYFYSTRSFVEGNSNPFYADAPGEGEPAAPEEPPAEDAAYGEDEPQDDGQGGLPTIDEKRRLKRYVEPPKDKPVENREKDLSMEYKPYTLKDYQLLEKTPIKLGGLGPDKRSDHYLEKLEKSQRQKEYANKVREQHMSTSIPVAEPAQKPAAVVRKGSSREDDLRQSKREAMLQYAATVPKPRVKRRSWNTSHRAGDHGSGSDRDASEGDNAHDDKHRHDIDAALREEAEGGYAEEEEFEEDEDAEARMLALLAQRHEQNKASAAAIRKELHL